MNEDYNGWTNRETWACNLWIDNDRALYEEVVGFIEATVEHHADNQAEAISCLADTLENFVEELFDFTQYNMIKQELLSMRNDIGSLWRVNWREIAESKLSEKVSA